MRLENFGRMSLQPKTFAWLHEWGGLLTAAASLLIQLIINWCDRIHYAHPYLIGDNDCANIHSTHTPTEQHWLGYCFIGRPNVRLCRMRKLKRKKNFSIWVGFSSVIPRYVSSCWHFPSFLSLLQWDWIFMRMRYNVFPSCNCVSACKRVCVLCTKPIASIFMPFLISLHTQNV